MTGCHSTETLQHSGYCTHCFQYVTDCKCMWDSIRKLEERITALTDMYKHLSVRVASCQDHKLRQIDENRKVSSILDEIQFGLDQLHKNRDLEDERIKELQTKVKASDDNPDIGHIWRSISHLHDRMNELMNKVNELQEQLCKNQ